MTKQTQEPECCPPFHPQRWDNKLIEWDNKRFIKASVRTFFYRPLNFGKVITRLMGVVKATQAEVPDYLCLSDHPSRWRMDIYLAVNKDIPGEENVVLTGKFFCKVYEGDFKETGQWCADYQALVTHQKLNIKKWYMWYTTCPKCAQKYGHNYVVIVGQVE